MNKIFFLFPFCSLMFIYSIANIRIPNILGSHMVLQQSKAVKIWGWGAPEELVTIKTSWDTTIYITKTGNGAKWITEIKTPGPGGPYRISISGSNEIILEDVLIGEVWVCSGQSNMEWSGDQKVQQSIDESPKANNKNIRFFYVPKATAEYPQDNVQGSWVVCSPEEMLHFSAIGYFFGKNLENNLKRPIGLINSNWGGTPAETWTPSYIIEQDSILLQSTKKQNIFSAWPNRVGIAYNAMIAPLTQFSIAGVIWYQGESNTERYYVYNKLFTKMIGAWRKAWDYDFPFYYVQIAPFAYVNKYIGALLREAQTEASQYPNTGMVVISDLVPDTNNIHPPLKKEVAERLANLALSKKYGFRNLICQSPSFDSYKIEKDKIIVSLKYAPNGLQIKGDEACCFEIAGNNKIFVEAQVKIQGSQIIVFNKSINQPIAVRFAFNNTSRPNLFSKEGLPVNLFRTDNWTLETNAVK